MPRAATQNRLLREAARERILRGSVAAFAEKGLAASMEDVAASSGVSKGLPYFYFRSKEELLVNALKERAAHLFEIGDALNPSVPPRARLAALIEGLLASVQRDPDGFRLYLVLSLQKGLSKTTARTLRDLGGPLSRYFEAVRAVFTDLGSADPDVDALVLRSALLGAFLRLVRGVEDIPIEKVCERLFRMFVGEPSN